MRQAMANAPVGDDQYGEDVSVNALGGPHRRPARQARPRCSCRAAPWPNQIAVKVLTRPGEEVITGGEAHLLWHEAGGASANAGVQIIALSTSGIFTAEELRSRLQAARPHGVPANHAGGDREHP